MGDVGDFAKYGLLRALAGDGHDALRLGVVWYLTPDEGHSGDGGHVRYLLPGNDHPYVDCDRGLYKGLRTLVMTGARSVGAIRTHGLLPQGTVFYESVLAPFGLSAARFAAARQECRAAP